MNNFQMSFLNKFFNHVLHTRSSVFRFKQADIKYATTEMMRYKDGINFAINARLQDCEIIIFLKKHVRVNSYRTHFTYTLASPRSFVTFVRGK